jgi:plasmid replication initiation protein
MRKKSSSLVVRQANSLVESSYHLSVAEMRLVWHLISHISPGDKDFLEYGFTASELGEMIGDESLTYEEAELIALRLWRREIHIQHETFKGAYRWVIRAKRDSNTGLIHIALDPELKPLLLGLKQWTQAKLEQLCSLSSSYSVRMYLWACRVRNQQQREWTVSVESLRAQLKIPAEEYARFSNFNAWVLRKPIEEINRATDLELNYQVLRKGRSPYAVRFSIVEGDHTSTGTGELVRVEKAKRAKQQKRTAGRQKNTDFSLPENHKEITSEERALAIEQLRRVKKEISTSKS